MLIYVCTHISMLISGSATHTHTHTRTHTHTDHTKLTINDKFSEQALHFINLKTELRAL